MWKVDVMVHIHNPSTSAERWKEAETEAEGPVSLEYASQQQKQERPCSNKGEVKTNSWKLPSDFHMHAVTHTCTHI